MTRLDTVAILERLVAYPTISRDTNLPLIEWVRNYLDDSGIRSHLVPDGTGNKANLLASVGPLVEGGLVLSGHTDVVPTDGQPWSGDPFKLLARGSRLQGRGTCDMKGFIATALSRITTLHAAKLSRPVHLMLSYDEEVGCLGAPSLISAAQERLPKPAVVIVGEPTGLRVANEHKGICLLRTRVKGVEAHSSLTHQGVSAVMLAAELIDHLNRVSRQIAAVPRPTQRYQPPYTSLSVNLIEGGIAINTLAPGCDFRWDIRTLPGETATTILRSLADFAQARLAELRKEGKTCDIDTQVLVDVPALQADDGAAEKLVRALLPQVSAPLAMPFATEAGQFQRAGWSTVVCGPGDIEQAHKADEFIERAELESCEHFIDGAIARQCS